MGGSRQCNQREEEAAASTPDPEGTRRRPVIRGLHTFPPAPMPDSHPGLLGGTCTHRRRGRSPAALGVPWALAEPPRGVGGFRRAGTEEPELGIFRESPGRVGGSQASEEPPPGLRRLSLKAVRRGSRLLPQLGLVLGGGGSCSSPGRLPGACGVRSPPAGMRKSGSEQTPREPREHN